MWEGGECWIIGGGPSIPHEFGVPEDVVEGVLSKELPLSTYSPYLSPIHDKHVIGINAAFYIGSWIDVLFFGDSQFYLDNKRAVDAWSKLKVSSGPGVMKRRDIQGVKYVPRAGSKPVGICSAHQAVSWNLNSGAASISLAYHLGVKRIYLLGFDMRLGEQGNQHWHYHYGEAAKFKRRDPKKLPFHRHLDGFKYIADDAKRLGLEIINVSPDSAITEFPRVKLKDIL